MSRNQCFYKFNVGDFECTSLYDGSKAMDLSKLLSGFDHHSDDHDQMIDMGFNVLHIKTDQNSILIDSGTKNGHLLSSMEEANINPNEIDTIVITHGDGDHIGGLASFANAKLYMVKESYDMWTSKAGMKKLLDEFERTMKHVVPPNALVKKMESRRSFAINLSTHLKARLHIVALGDDILPGFQFLEAIGHRSDHFAVEIRSENSCLIHIADAFRHPIQLEGGFSTIFDAYPEMTIKTMKRLQELALAQNAQIFGSHISFPGNLSLNDKRQPK